MADPRTPEALLASIRKAIEAMREAVPACGRGTDEEIERAERVMSARLNVVGSLEKLIPDPPRSTTDVVCLAEVARLAEGSLCSALKLLPKAVLHMERDLAERTLTSQGAAAEIVALINSRATSPRQEEIEAILAKVSGSPPVQPKADAVGRLSALRAAIDDVETLLDSGDLSDEECDRLEATTRRVDKLTTIAWATPPHTFADLQERALIARHCHRDAECGKFEGDRWVRAPGPWVVPSDCDSWSDKGIAELIHAILGFTGELTAGPGPSPNPTPWQQTRANEGEDLLALSAELRAAKQPLREAFEVVNEMSLGSKEHPAAEARFQECQARFDALRNRIWATGPASPEGCAVLAEIAQFDAYDWPAPYPQIPLTGGDYIDGDPARLALGHLAMAVLRMGGRRYAGSPESGDMD